MPIPRHYSYDPRKLNIILAQLRCNASFLNYDLCKLKFHQMFPETVAPHMKIFTISFLIKINIQIIGEYYLVVLIVSIGYFLSLRVDVNLLTKGSDFLTYQENTTILKHILKYIKKSPTDTQLFK